MTPYKSFLSYFNKLHGEAYFNKLKGESYQKKAQNSLYRILKSVILITKISL